MAKKFSRPVELCCFDQWIKELNAILTREVLPMWSGPSDEFPRTFDPFTPDLDWRTRESNWCEQGKKFADHRKGVQLALRKFEKEVVAVLYPGSENPWEIKEYGRRGKVIFRGIEDRTNIRPTRTPQFMVLQRASEEYIAKAVEDKAFNDIRRAMFFELKLHKMVEDCIIFRGDRK